MRTIAARTDRRSNAFDALRLLAASLVLVAHCYTLTGREEPGRVASLFGIGVVMFFAMSGFLVTRSWQAQPELRAFALKRALRLFPALVVVVVLTAFALGPVVTALPVAEYLAEPGTYLYVLKCSLLWTVQNQLPGVFEGNVYPLAVNGSLWTLPVEALAYAGVALAGLAGALRGPLPALAAIVVGCVLLTPAVDLDAHVTLSAGDADGTPPTAIVQLYVAFAVGMLLWIARDRVGLRWRFLVPAVALWVLSWETAWETAVTAVAVPYAAIFAAFRLPPVVNAVNERVGDPSYGIYITAFPIQQTLAYFWGPSLSPGVMLAITFPTAFVLGVLSWQLVERRALAHKPARRPAPARAAAREPQPTAATTG